ncbi:hypothetical protein FRX31_027672 [Thalictrum thalictroides]|uniref:FAS1 domain-containing protein n=1 Tax=Thalictrum thalictroides TaxID=46969 RepID=A0A7J6VDJ0_THATH|nr:hypothetical protein FRX31_027672 [Thalictrum thalictroides]
MSLTLELTLPTLISSALTNNNNINTCTITIFVPSDTSFFALKYYGQPPLTLLKYHVALVKLEKKDLNVVRPLGSKTILYPWFDEVVFNNMTASKAPSLLQQEFVELFMYALDIMMVALGICTLRKLFEKRTTGYELVEES